MNNEKKIKQEFRKILSQELSSPEVKRAKRDLISQFSPAHQFGFKPAVLIPIFGIIFAVLVVYQMRPESPKQEVKEVPVIRTASVPSVPKKLEPVKVKAVTKQIEKIFRTETPLDVKVTRVSSDIGSAMVFQKDYEETPVTVIWVFTGGANQ